MSSSGRFSADTIMMMKNWSTGSQIYAKKQENTFVYDTRQINSAIAVVKEDAGSAKWHNDINKKEGK